MILSFFRPTSLVGGVYKILAKVLALRVRKVAGKIMGPFQHAFAFVPGRQILDAALIAMNALIVISDRDFEYSL